MIDKLINTNMALDEYMEFLLMITTSQSFNEYVLEHHHALGRDKKEKFHHFGMWIDWLEGDLFVFFADGDYKSMLKSYYGSHIDGLKRTMRTGMQWPVYTYDEMRETKTIAKFFELADQETADKFNSQWEFDKSHALKIAFDFLRQHYKEIYQKSKSKK